MRPSISEILDRLRAEGLADADARPKAAAALARTNDDEDDVPWYLRAAVGFGAWIATAFLLAFFIELFHVNDDATLVVLGLVLLPIAVLVRRMAAAEFVRQAAVAVALAGQGLVMFGIGGITDSGAAAGVAGVVLSLPLIWLMPDRVHRFLVAAVGAISALIAAAGLDERVAFELAILVLVAVTGYTWRGDLRDRTDDVAEMLAPVGYGLVVALFLALSFSGTAATELARELGAHRGTGYAGPLTTIGITVALGALALAILGEHGAPRQSTLTYATLAGVAALGLGALSSPGIVAGAAVLALAFDRRNPVLLGLGVLGLLVFGSMYYYSLQLTLLEKSGVLVGTGLLFLAVRSRLPVGPDREIAR